MCIEERGVSENRKPNTVSETLVVYYTAIYPPTESQTEVWN